MIQKHIDTLIKIGDNDQMYVGSNSMNWANYVLSDNKLDISLDRRFNRYELLDYCNDLNNDTLSVLVAILSWGGMNRKHGISLFSNQNTILELANYLRNGLCLTRKDAFQIFHKNRANGKLPGLGVGYYTKLICFLAPKLNGYIMDQWVSKSINLLVGRDVVDITNDNWVNDNNNSDTYEVFCNYIDHLAIFLDCSGFEAEKRLFSSGRRQGVWRNYLIQNYSKK